MRVAVLGAGAVGGMFAALLDRAGCDVEVTARGDNLAAIREHGIRLDGGFGEHVARVAAGEHLTVRPDLALVTTKAHDGAGAIAPERELLDGVPVIISQNGLGGLAVAHELLPRSPLVGALVLTAVSFLEPGRVTVTAPLPTIIGRGPGCSEATLERVRDLLEPTGIELELTPDLPAAQWSKLMINHVNALPAIVGMSVQEVVADDDLRRILAVSLVESARVARASGVRFTDLQGYRGEMFESMADAPISVVEGFVRDFAARLGPVPNPASTLQSIRRGRLTEIDYLNGATVQAAAAVGLDTPVNRALVELVHEVERTGQHLTPAEVVERIPV